MHRVIVLAVALAAACFVVSTAGAVTAPPTKFTDATGDAGTAPDIARVTVTNDDHGLYRFVVSFATPYSADAEISLFLDTDQNAATGDKYGADYLFRDDHAAHTFNLSSWKGSYWLAIPNKTANVAIAPDNMSMTFTVNKSDLGNVTKFNFFVLSLEGAAGAGNSDVAPDSGRFTYAHQAVVTLSVGSSHDGAAKAGGTWTVSMKAVRSDTHATVGSEGSIACKATDGSKTLALVRHAFVSSGSAVCTFRVPKTPKHAALHATMTVSDGGRSVSKSFTAKTT